jgi:hypothetical protein
MLLLSAFFIAAQAPDIKSLDTMAQNRDVAGLSQFLTPDSLKPINPIQVLKTNGAYETGKFGWHALELTPPDQSKTFVVLATPITSEDIGEMVFERQGAAYRTARSRAQRTLP